MDATGLQPTTKRSQSEPLDKLQGMPGRDHESYWVHPPTGSTVLLHEPYALNPNLEPWLQPRGYHRLAPKWQGIYYPGGCYPELVSKDQALLARLAPILAALPELDAPEAWPYPTGRSGDDFESPQRQLDAKPRTRRRVRPSYNNRNGATPYGGAVGVPSRGDIR